jgi:DNA polymerase-3 subunit gamma/tau
MNNLALYRKYRPRAFSEVVGQENVVKTLTNAVAVGFFSHAYLFSGPRGSGKTTIARLLAKALNCRSRRESQFEPCGKCSSCLEIQEGNSFDLIEIDAASHRGIDEIRELKEGIKFSPAKEKYKIFIIDEAHQLTKEAANALLKTLEEPPSYAVFILATTEAHKMIPTIVSRCQRFDFKRLTLPEIIRKLEVVAKGEKKKIEKAALELIAFNSGGSIRDAESLLDQVFTFSGILDKEEIIKAEDVKTLLGLTDINLIGRFVDLICEKDLPGMLKLLNEALDSGHDPQEFAKTLNRYLRQALLLKINPKTANPTIDGLTEEQKKKILIQAGKLGLEEIQRSLNLFLEAENKIKHSSIPQLPLELAAVELIEQQKAE